jgi:energy-coupling factor transporter ATP-binding protein EcfA2
MTYFMAVSAFHTNPFPGIRSFEIDESHWFFGREEQTIELVNRLKVTRFLAIVGPSGCGKSSLIKAGLIPKLLAANRRNRGKEMPVFIFRPGDNPIVNLSKAIARNGNTPESIVKSLREGNTDLLDQMKQNGMVAEESLLVIDQFEELFRFKRTRSSIHSINEARIFVDLIVHIARQTELRVNVVLSMRTDFLDDCTEFREFSDMINKGYYLVPRMTDEEKARAITGPVNIAGSRITEELKIVLLKDVSDNPDQLPIMQHALMRTWDYWQINKTGEQPVGLEHYLATGTMKEALSVHLEEIYADLGDNRRKNYAEKLFKALTDITKESRGTRRPTLLGDICTLTGAREEDIIDVIDAFRQPGCAFLMPATHVPLNKNSVIDISHESIMRVWSRLKIWVEEETASAQLYLRLSKSAELYQEGKTGLWVNPDLQLALQWKQHTRPNAIWATRYDPAFERAMNFLDYSRKQHELAISRKETQQKRSLKRARNSAIFLGFAALISILFLIISLNLRFKAEASHKEALEKEQMALSESRRAEEQRKEAILQRRISEQQQQIAQQQEMISEQQRQYAVQQQIIAEQQRREAIQQRQQADISRAEAILSKDEAERQRQEALEQQRIAEQERVRAEESERDARRLRLLATAKSLAIQASQLHTSSDDNVSALLALYAFELNNENGGYENDPVIYEALSAITSDPLRMRGHADAVRAAVMNRDGTALFSVGDDSRLLKWDLQNPMDAPEPLYVPPGMPQSFRSVSIVGDDEWLVSGTISGSIIFRDMQDKNAPFRTLMVHKATVNALQGAGPGSNSFFSAGADGQLIQWVLDDENYHFRTLDNLKSGVRSLALSPCKKKLAYGTESGQVKIIAVDDPLAKPELLKDLYHPVLSLAFSQAGNILAVGLQNGDINILTPVAENADVQTIRGRHLSGVTGLAFNDDDTEFASSSFDWTVKISAFPLSEEVPISIQEHDFWVYGILFTPDSRHLISYSADRSVALVSTQNSDLAAKLKKTITRNLTEEEWRRLIGEDIPYKRIFEYLP